MSETDYIGRALDAYGLRKAVLRAGDRLTFAAVGEARAAMEAALRAWAADRAGRPTGGRPEKV